MFQTEAHFSHALSWQCVIPGHQDNSCLLCLIHVLGNTEMSTVQRQVTLHWIKALLDEKGHQDAVNLMSEDDEFARHFLDILADHCTSSPFTEVSSMVFVAVNELVCKESMYQYAMYKCHNLMAAKADEDSFVFSLSVMAQICELDGAYSSIMILENVETFHLVVDASSTLKETTVKVLLRLVTAVMDALTSAAGDQEGDTRTNLLLWNILKSEVHWISRQWSSKELVLSSLKLLLETMKSENIARGLLKFGEHTNHPVSLLMGLKKILATKDEVQVFLSLQCVEKIFHFIRETKEVTAMLETDLAEFVFGSLHSRDSELLMSAYRCLELMASHQVFFDKCHAVYGIGSCLSALTLSLELDMSGVTKIGLSFLATLLEKEPDDMPLITNALWRRCLQILETLLTDRWSALFTTTVHTVRAILRPVHQVTPPDVASLVLLLQTLAPQLKQVLQSENSSLEENQFLFISALDVALRAQSLISFASSKCGIDESRLEEFQQSLNKLHYNVILPTFQKLSSCPLPQIVVEKFLACLDTLLELGQAGEVIVSSGLLCSLLYQLSQPHINERIRVMGGHTVVRLLLHLLPTARFNQDMLLFGLSKFNWHLWDPTQMIEDLASRETAATLVVLLYVHIKHSCIIWQETEVLVFLNKAVTLFPDLLHSDDGIIKAFVYLFTLTDASSKETEHLSTDLERFMQDELVRLPMEQWYLPEKAVFQWAFRTEERAERIGSQMLERWLLDSSQCHTEPLALSMPLDQLDVIAPLCFNSHFLSCLVGFVRTLQSCNKWARDILIFCISKISDAETNDQSVESVVLLQLLVDQTTADTMGGLWTNTDHTGDAFLMPVICCLLSSPHKKLLNWNFCVKTILHVSRLLVQKEDDQEVVNHCLFYLSTMSCLWTPQESRTVIPALMQEAGFHTVIEAALTSSNAELAKAALTLTVWLSQHSSDCQAKHPVVVSIDFVMTSLFKNVPHLSESLLHLLSVALSPEECACNAVGFVRNFPHFILSSEFFTGKDLRQIFVYLQQYLIQNDVSLRRAAAVCFEKFLHYCNLRDISVLTSPWTVPMLEVMLAACRTTLSQADVQICFLLSEHLNLWTTVTVHNYLLALLESNLSTEFREKAKCVLNKVKVKASSQDHSLVERAQTFLSQSETDPATC